MKNYQRPIVKFRPDEGVILALEDGSEVLLDFAVARSLAQMLIQELGDAQDLANGKSAMLRRSA